MMLKRLNSRKAPARPLHAAPCSRRPLRVAAVLKDPPPAQGSSGRDASEQQPGAALKLRDRLERLLPPSLSGTQTAGGARGGDARELTCADSEVFYFAYGANLSLNVLKRRGVAPISRSPACVLDPSVRLVFQHRGGYSTLRQLQGTEAPRYTPYMAQVHGVVYQLSKEDLKALAKREGGYQLTDIEVETYDGWRVRAKTFVSGPLATLQAEVTPTEKYMKQVRDGAADNFLDPLHQAWLSSIETVPSVGLGPEYYNTPSKWLGYSFLSIVALVVVGFFAQP